VWAGTWIAGFALMYQAVVWAGDWFPGYGYPVKNLGEPGICAVWLALGAAMTWILAVPVHHRDVPGASRHLSRWPPGAGDVQASRSCLIRARLEPRSRRVGLAGRALEDRVHGPSGAGRVRPLVLGWVHTGRPGGPGRPRRQAGRLESARPITHDLETWAGRDWTAVIDLGPEREHLAGPLPPFPVACCLANQPQ
jgi:hypothetical protein